MLGSDGLTNSLGVSGVRLIPLDIRLDVLRRDQSDRMSQTGKLARPVMSSRASLHSDQTSRQLPEKGNQLVPRQTPAQHRLATLANSVKLEDGFRKIKANRHDCGHEILPGSENPHPIRTLRKGVVHAIKWAVQRSRYMTLVWDFFVKPFFNLSVTTRWNEVRIRGEPMGGARYRAATLYSVSPFEPKP
jgi:hypothetical protein